MAMSRTQAPRGSPWSLPVHRSTYRSASPRRSKSPNITLVGATLVDAAASQRCGPRRFTRGASRGTLPRAGDRQCGTQHRHCAGHQSTAISTARTISATGAASRTSAAPGHQGAGITRAPTPGCSQRRSWCACGGRLRLAAVVVVVLGRHHAAHGVPNARSGRLPPVRGSAMTSRRALRVHRRGRCTTAADGAPDAIPSEGTPIRDTFPAADSAPRYGRHAPSRRAQGRLRASSLRGHRGTDRRQLDAAIIRCRFGWCAAIGRRPCGSRWPAPAAGAAFVPTRPMPRLPCSGWAR